MLVRSLTYAVHWHLTLYIKNKIYRIKWSQIFAGRWEHFCCISYSFAFWCSTI